jgi:hypothetical protein
MKYGLLLVLFLLTLHAAAAATSVEQIVVRMVSHDPASNTYTFSCDLPADSVSPRTWSVRPDSGGGTIEERQSDGRLFMTSRITNSDLWHIGCQTNIVVNGQWKNIRGDFHIELRPYENQEIIVHNSNGRTADMSCRPQEAASGLVKWTFLDASTGAATTIFDQQRITYTVPEAGLWDLECDMNGKHYNLPVEYFNEGPAYVPNTNGCIPGEACPGTTAPTCTPTTETCNQKDDDCDGQVDENACTQPLNTCANSVKDVPVTCTSAITSDTWNGCRQVSCGSGSDTIQVLACDKTGFFEIYKQGSSGNAPRVCLGTTCIQSEGYAKSSTFPICSTTQPPACTPTNEVCDSKDNDCDGQTDEDNVCAQPPSSACYGSVKDIPATCSGGTITQTTYDGCRHVVCASNGQSMQAMACDKSGFFEMYKQGYSGSGAFEICLAGTCLKHTDGYAKSGSFPVCTSGTQGNTAPVIPGWVEPTEGKSDMDPVDFHIHIAEMTDADGDTHAKSDFEVWDTAANQRVWSATGTHILTHIHNADGTFEGRLAGQNKLENDTRSARERTTAAAQ